MKSRQTTFTTSIFIVALILFVTGLTWINYRFSVQNPGGNDFLARWMGANKWLKEGLSPYDERVSLATQNMIYGHPADPSIGEDVNHFVYPMHSMVFFAPFGLMDYLPARVAWMTTLELCAIALVFIGLRLADWRVSPLKLTILLLFSLLWYHGARTVIIGQFAGINAALIALALLFIIQQQDVAAGILLALSTTKPQMTFLLVPFVVIWAFSAKRYKLMWSTILSFLALMAVFLLIIPDWPMQMFRQMLDYPDYTDIGSPLSIIANAMPGLSETLNGVLHVVAVFYLLIEWVLAWGKDERSFFWAALMTMTVTNLIALRTATTNYVMLLPVLFLVFRVWEQRWKSAGKAGVWGTLLVLFAGPWVLFITTVEGNYESPLMYLPLPFFCLFALWWVRWWAIRPPRLMLEEFAAHMK